ncbi:MAG: HNH endonuclease [Reichenbachiella sp.]
MNEGKVLVLNQDYSPLTVCSVYRAFLLVYLKKAELLESNNEKKLCSVNVEYPRPTVIKIKNYVLVPYRGVVLTRYNIFKRDNHQCQYCGTEKDLTLDHLIPRSKGGKTSWKNLVTACKKCNAFKGDLNLEDSGLVLERLPYKPSYLMFLKNNFGKMNKDWLRYLKKDAVA